MPRSILLALVLVTGCALPYRAQSLEDGRNAHNRPFRQERAGVLLSADLLETPAAVQAHFHQDLGEHQLVAVIVHIENQGERACVLRRSRVGLQLEGASTPLDPIDPALVIEEHLRPMTGVYLGIPLVVPAFVQHQRRARYNFQLTRDYLSKAFPDYLRLAPGDPPRAWAFFFRVPPEQRDLLGRSPVLEVSGEVEAGQERAQGQEIQFLLSLG